jgi:hypothetical protein
MRGALYGPVAETFCISDSILGVDCYEEIRELNHKALQCVEWTYQAMPPLLDGWCFVEEDILIVLPNG